MNDTHASLQAVCFAVLVSVMTVLASGCCAPPLPVEKVAGQGISKTISRNDEFDLILSGNKCTVIVERGTVRSLSVSGDGHDVAMRPEATVRQVGVSGNGNRVRLPDPTASTQLTTWGNGNTIE